MARIPPYMWDVGMALGLFLLYLELKNINLVTAEEKQLWADYYRKQQQQAQQQQAQGGSDTWYGGILRGVVGVTTWLTDVPFGILTSSGSVNN